LVCQTNSDCLLNAQIVHGIYLGVIKGIDKIDQPESEHVEQVGPLILAIVQRRNKMRRMLCFCTKLWDAEILYYRLQLAYGNSWQTNEDFFFFFFFFFFFQEVAFHKRKMCSVWDCLEEEEEKEDCRRE
jgi:hypothetical protein